MEEPYIIISQQMDNVQFSWIWFLLIPYLIFLGYITYSELRGDTMAILGMQMSGKTTLLRHMQGLPFDPYYKPTEAPLYKEVNWKIGDRKIKAGVDLGGGNEWVKDNYPELIAKNDIIIFVFDAYEFENDIDYKRSTLGRIDFVFNLIEREKRQELDSFIEHHFALIGTHSDKIRSESPRSLIRKWQKDYSEKPYSKVFKNNIALLDMRNADEINTILKKLFL